MPDRVLVTGASGFIGRRLVTLLKRQGRPLSLVGRSTRGTRDEVCGVGPVDGATDWAPHLDAVDSIIHLAGRAHVLTRREALAIEPYRAANVDGTRRLARAAAEHGVRRLVFVSTIKVHGEATSPGVCFRADDRPAPAGPYAISKWEAECALHEVAAETGLQVVVVRPPLVYGPGARANFARLVEWVAKGRPLPLAAVDNRRSLVAADNLADLLVCCLDHPAAAGRTLLVSDGHDVSTPELIRMLADAAGKRPRLFSVPPPALRLAGRLTGRRSEVERLIGSLQVDMEATRDRLDWSPPEDMKTAVRKAVRALLSC